MPEWFELDDADYVDLLQELKEEEERWRLVATPPTIAPFFRQGWRYLFKRRRHTNFKARCPATAAPLRGEVGIGSAAALVERRTVHHWVDAPAILGGQEDVL